MYKCRIKLKDVAFHPQGRLVFGGVKDIVATMMDPPDDISAVPRPDKTMFQIGTREIPKPGGKAGEKETVQVLKIYLPSPQHRTGGPAKGQYKNGVQLLYQLPASSGFSILGIAFDKVGGDDPGEYEFPLVTINRDDDASELAVIDMGDQAQAYSYGIVMQAADGTIGVYDPFIENEVPDSDPGA